MPKIKVLATHVDCLKHEFDGVETLPDLVSALHEVANEYAKLVEAGAVLVDPVCDGGYVRYERPDHEVEFDEDDEDADTDCPVCNRTVTA